METTPRNRQLSGFRIVGGRGHGPTHRIVVDNELGWLRFDDALLVTVLGPSVVTLNTKAFRRLASLLRK